MKYLHTIFIATLCLFSCDQPTSENIRRGFAEAIKISDNDVAEFINFPTLQKLNSPDKYIIRLEEKNSNGFRRSTLNISNFSESTDTIIPFAAIPGVVGDMTPNARYYRLAADGDVHCGRYEPNTSFSNRVIIDSFDVDRGYIKGRFDLSYVREPDSGCLPAPFDTLILHDGVFEIDGFTTF